VDQAQQLHLRAALLKQVLVEQELLIGIQLQKLQHSLQFPAMDFLQIRKVVHLQ
jgi:hypothetical protein